ncbi:MAG: polyhydroxyalkanoate synthesis repressor PhaR [Pseudomonadota bacterium]
MANKNESKDVVVIKKYANRRLYDTSTSSYVTLDHLSDLVRREIDFEVVDAKTGEDLTRQVLTQIIFEQETKGEGALPINFLRQLIGMYGGGAQSLLPAWLDMSMNSFSEAQERWKQSVGGAANPFAMFEKQARANMELFENAMRMFTPAATSADRDESKASEKGGPLDPMTLLRRQMDAMQSQIDALSGKN